MHTDRFDALARSLDVRTRRGVARAVAGAGVAFLSLPVGAGARRGKQGKRRNPCKGRNWCVDRTHTCGPAGGYGKCLIKAFGGNVCAEILFQTADCADCEPPTCTDCVCVLAAGGGDRCNNGVNGSDFICARA